MPAQDGSWLDGEKRLVPARPEPHERDPETPVDVVETGPRPPPLEDGDLLSEGHEVCLGGERCTKGSDEEMERFNHSAGECRGLGPATTGSTAGPKEF